MDESSVYNESDVAPFRRRLNDLRTIIKSDSESGKHSDAMTKLLERQLWTAVRQTSLVVYYSSHLNSQAESVLSRLQDNLSVLSEELQPIHERLVTIRRKLLGWQLRRLPQAELKPLQEELRKSTRCVYSAFVVRLLILTRHFRHCHRHLHPFAIITHSETLGNV